MAMDPGTEDILKAVVEALVRADHTGQLRPTLTAVLDRKAKARTENYNPVEAGQLTRFAEFVRRIPER